MIENRFDGFEAIPSLPTTLPADTRRVLEPMRRMLQIMSGADGKGRALTMADLNGLSKGVLTGEYLDYPPADGLGPELDFTPPPAPEGLEAFGALANIMLSWDDIPEYYRTRYAYTEIWRSGTNDIGTAVKVGSSIAPIYPDPLGQGAKRFYWIRFVSKANVPGPFNAQAGTAGETAYDASYLIDVLSANPPPGTNYNKLLYVQADPNLVVDGVPIPMGTYMSMAYIADLSVTRAKIGLLAVDDARIATLHAAKIVAGDISADRMSANIVQATVGKFSSLSALTANLGTVQINEFGYLRSQGVASFYTGVGIWMGYDNGAYKFRLGNPAGQSIYWDGNNLTITGDLSARTVNTGSYSGYFWPPDGGQGVHIGPGGILAGNGNTGTYFQYSAGEAYFAMGAGGGGMVLNGNGLRITGNAHFAGNITGSNGTFYGSLAAVNGTFSGVLTGDAVNAVNTINLAGDAVTIGSASSGQPASVTINAIGVRTVIFAQATVVIQTGGDSSVGMSTLTISRNGVPIQQVQVGGFAPTGSQQAIGHGVTFIVDYPSGQVTYSAESAGGDGLCYIYVEQTKR